MSAFDTSDAPDPIEVPHDATRRLLGGDLKVELRGYEVAAHRSFGLVVVAKYSPSESGRKAALASAKRLNEQAADRNDPVTYSIRPVVSMEIPEQES